MADLSIIAILSFFGVLLCIALAIALGVSHG